MVDILLLVVGIVLLVAAIALYRAERSQARQDVSRQRFITGLAYVGLILFLIGLGRAIEDILAPVWFFRIGILLGLVALATAVGQWITWSQRKKRAGQLLLRLGRFSTDKWQAIAGGIFILFAIAQTGLLVARVTGITSGDRGLTIEFDITQALIFGSIGIYFLAVGLSGVEFREDGICYRLRVFPWREISSYDWNGKRSHRLILWLKKYWLFGKTQTLSIPSRQTDAVDRILERHLSNSREAAESRL
jgi:hypothetical protein